MSKKIDDDITWEKIEALKREAGLAGDLELKEVCRRALDGDEKAIRECGKIFAAARALK